MQEAVEVNKDNANAVSIEERRLALKSKIEETKFDYRKGHRPGLYVL